MLLGAEDGFLPSKELASVRLKSSIIPVPPGTSFLDSCNVRVTVVVSLNLSYFVPSSSLLKVWAKLETDNKKVKSVIVSIFLISYSFWSLKA